MVNEKTDGTQLCQYCRPDGHLSKNGVEYKVFQFLKEQFPLAVFHTGNNLAFRSLRITISSRYHTCLRQFHADYRGRWKSTWLLSRICKITRIFKTIQTVLTTCRMIQVLRFNPDDTRKCPIKHYRLSFRLERLKQEIQSAFVCEDNQWTLPFRLCKMFYPDQANVCKYMTTELTLSV